MSRHWLHSVASIFLCVVLSLSTGNAIRSRFDLGVTTLDRPFKVREAIAEIHRASRSFEVHEPVIGRAILSMRVVGQYRQGWPTSPGSLTMLGYTAWSPLIGTRTILAAHYSAQSRKEQVLNLLHEAHHVYWKSGPFLTGEVDAEAWAHDSLFALNRSQRFQRWLAEEH